jgi:hypothetical protein
LSRLKAVLARNTTYTGREMQIATIPATVAIVKSRMLWAVGLTLSFYLLGLRFVLARTKFKTKPWPFGAILEGWNSSFDA